MQVRNLEMQVRSLEMEVRNLKMKADRAAEHLARSFAWFHESSHFDGMEWHCWRLLVLYIIYSDGIGWTVLLWEGQRLYTPRVVSDTGGFEDLILVQVLLLIKFHKIRSIKSTCENDGRERVQKP